MYIILISLVRAKAIMFSVEDKDTRYCIKGWGLAYEGKGFMSHLHNFPRMRLLLGHPQQECCRLSQVK